MSHHHPQRNQVFGGRPVLNPPMFSPNQLHNNNNNNSHFMVQDQQQYHHQDQQQQYLHQDQQQQYLGNFSNVPASNGYWGTNGHLDYNGLHHQPNGLHHQPNGHLQHQTMVNDFSPREMLFPQAQILTSPGNNFIFFHPLIYKETKEFKLIFEYNTR